MKQQLTSQMVQTDLEMLMARQALRNPKAAQKLNANLKAVEHEKFLNKHSDRFNR